MTRQIYCVGIKLENKDAYDKLMEKHSKQGVFGLDFEQCFSGYPDGYPCLLQYTTDRNPFIGLNTFQLNEILEDGYTIVLELETDS